MGMQFRYNLDLYFASAIFGDSARTKVAQSLGSGRSLDLSRSLKKRLKSS